MRSPSKHFAESSGRLTYLREVVQSCKLENTSDISLKFFTVPCLSSDSLQMYDHHQSTSDKAPKVKCSPNVHFEEDLNTPDVNFDFQGFLPSPPTPAEEGGLFSSPSLDASSSASSLDHQASGGVIVKQEPPDYNFYKSNPFSNTNTSTSRPGSTSRKSSKKIMDKNSEEYKRRRARNNLAVRKSREKAKQRSRETENRVTQLKVENDNLKKQAEILTKELTIIKSLLKNVGVSNESIDMEISQVLQHHHSHQQLSNHIAQAYSAS